MVQEKLINGNLDFLNDRCNGDYSLYIREDKTNNGQHPFAIVITCSDSRVVPEIIFNASLGDLFVIRVAGNVVGDYELSSVAYALKHLNTKCVLVLGHTNCGAIEAALSNHDAGKARPLVNNIRRAINGILDKDEATKANILNSLNTIKNHFKKDKDLAQIEYFSAIYEIDSGAVKFL
ncbi:MAG: carbonic anhydrase [Bacilli bacterium]|nr:carbonic anhydrase [Bacilli bacterium]